MQFRWPDRNGEAGFLLIGLVVAIFLLALTLTIAAPTVARSIERDREVESKHRADEYVRAIHNYYLKFGSYPTSVDQLLSQNNQHFLRQEYKDPLTGGEYRLIHYGEAKTQVKGFFGEPLEGVQQGSLGALAGNASRIGIGAGGAGAATSGSTTGASSGSAVFGSGGFSLGGSSNSTGTGGTSATGATGTGTTGTGGTATTGTGSTGGGTSATQFQGSKGMIVGVGSTATGAGLLEWNGETNKEDWEDLYDHRTWLIKQRISIFGGSPAAGGSGGGGLGTSTGTSAGSFGASGTSGSGTSAGQPATSPTGFGGSFGSSTGSGTSAQQPRQ